MVTEGQGWLGEKRSKLEIRGLEITLVKTPSLSEDFWRPGDQSCPWLHRGKVGPCGGRGHGPPRGWDPGQRRGSWNPHLERGSQTFPPTQPRDPGPDRGLGYAARWRTTSSFGHAAQSVTGRPLQGAGSGQSQKVVIADLDSAPSCSPSSLPVLCCPRDTSRVVMSRDITGPCGKPWHRSPGQRLCGGIRGFVPPGASPQRTFPPKL